MSYKIETIEGIGPAYASKLMAAGIDTDADLLTKAGSATGRDQLAKVTGISTTLILRWTNHADLMRISGVAGQFAELLEAAGVDTVKELATRNPANLAVKLAETNAHRRLAGVTPSESQVAGWIGQAKILAPAITH